MEKYQKVKKHSIDSKEVNDCAVVATSIVTDLPYDVVHAAFKKAGRKDRKGTYPEVSLKAWQLLGYDHETIFVDRFKEDSKIPSLMKGKKITAKQIKEHKEYFGYFGNFFMFCSLHVAAVSDGVLQDWTANKGNKQFYKMVFLKKIGV